MQQTLQDKFSLSGKGLHTGLNLTITFCPAPADHGLKVQRVDLEGSPVIEALAENVIDTSRGTVIGNADLRVSTIEHGLASLMALGIDNCLIQVDGPEFPILDGSARFYVDNILRVGIVRQDAPRRYLTISEPLEYYDEISGSCLRIEPSDHLSIDSTIEFHDSQFVQTQRAAMTDVNDFADEIASARTFVFVREIEPLLQMGLIKGGDLTNALVIYERRMSQQRLDALADTLGVEHRDADHLGYLQQKPLTWENEPARHKLLDILGDLALVGRPIKGHIIAVRPGHKANNKFARLLRAKHCS
ncbi:UDP-3-O-[3-hydroxymyristoyl] N-acetylglucosamine deacetylase [Alloprevotella sp. OH1205_COT-284]|nr:UDP-3-O-[3-hydroxymyristoyl] N-acetylglucosamine deacetylase [Alloprevotella sp. OH1205_COT-284]